MQNWLQLIRNYTLQRPNFKLIKAVQIETNTKITHKVYSYSRLLQHTIQIQGPSKIGKTLTHSSRLDLGLVYLNLPYSISSVSGCSVLLTSLLFIYFPCYSASFFNCSCSTSFAPFTFVPLSLSHLSLMSHKVTRAKRRIRTRKATQQLLILMSDVSAHNSTWSLCMKGDRDLKICLVSQFAISSQRAREFKILVDTIKNYKHVMLQTMECLFAAMERSKEVIRLYNLHIKLFCEKRFLVTRFCNIGTSFEFFLRCHNH